LLKHVALAETHDLRAPDVCDVGRESDPFSAGPEHQHTAKTQIEPYSHSDIDHKLAVRGPLDGINLLDQLFPILDICILVDGINVRS
jgi:hypothetical protein